MKIFNGTYFFYLLAVLTILFIPEPGYCESFLEVGHFSKYSSADDLLRDWEPLIFSKIEKHTQYNIIKDNSIFVIKAESSASASGLMRRIRIDPKEYPIIEWRWKVENIYNKGDVSKKSGDDFPARLYIAFEYDKSRVNLMERVKYKLVKLVRDETPPLCAVNYIWGSKAPVGLVAPNPYTEKVVMIALESGSSKLGQWVDERQNIYKDFNNIFGYDPPFINCVAIMTDSDNTGESATAYYGDIRFLKE
ncbi:MAG: DUF3047 domain-containing protein [Desulfobacterales bacterium]|nr:DUF3047 domain-containing protein [Desulfobacterales bacterium]